MHNQRRVLTVLVDVELNKRLVSVSVGQIVSVAKTVNAGRIVLVRNLSTLGQEPNS